VLDGWWAEGYNGANGWALSGDIDPDHGAQDHRHSEELFRLLREEVLPEFAQRDDSGIPRAWVARVKASLKSNGPEFAAGRMLRDYQQGYYAGQGAAH
jgi:starch phosphorylase